MAGLPAHMVRDALHVEVGAARPAQDAVPARRRPRVLRAVVVKTAIVSGAVANKYLNGGAVWTRLSWLTGMRKLGFDTYFVEQLSGLGTDGADVPARVAFFDDVMAHHGFSGRAALVDDEGADCRGM